MFDEPTNVVLSPLRTTDRTILLRCLAKLGASDPARRAAGALQATQMLERKGLTWAALLPAQFDASVAAPLPPAWRVQALKLAEHPDVSPEEQAYLLKFAGWRAPGAAALSWLREVAARIKAVEARR